MDRGPEKGAPFFMISRLLAECKETPELIYSRPDLDRAVAAFQAARPHRLYFALKACYRPPVLRHLAQLGLGAEVMSELESWLAQRAGFEELICNGLGRSPEFLSWAARGEGRRLVIDSALEAAEVRGRRVGLRLSLELSQDEGYQQISKLGLVPDSVEFRTAREAVEVEFLHLHLASQKREASLFVSLMGQLETLVPQFPRLKAIDFGGGWETAQDLIEGELERFGRLFRERFPSLELWLEPGRGLVNGAGYVVTTVIGRKHSRGRNFIILDAPTNTLMPHKEATYRLLHPEPGERYRADLVDGITSLTSTIKHGVGFARPPEVGERLVLGNCGAYTSSMSQFWAHRPVRIRYFDGERFLPDLGMEEMRRLEEALFRFRVP